MFKYDVLRAASRSSNALQIGRAAEHLVCADALVHGYHAQLAAQGSPYDVLIDVGSRLLRIQVKATALPRSASRLHDRECYIWNPRCGRSGRKRIDRAVVDAVALVALDIVTIAYLETEFVGSTIEMAPPGRPVPEGTKSGVMRGLQHFPLDKLMRDLGI